MTAIRRLAAILAADVAGYSRLIGADEGGTLERLRTLRRELLDPKIAEHRGRLVKTTGDGLQSFRLAGRQAQARQEKFRMVRVAVRRGARHHDGGDGPQPLNDFSRFVKASHVRVAGSKKAIGHGPGRDLLQRLDQPCCRIAKSPAEEVGHADPSQMPCSTIARVEPQRGLQMGERHIRLASPIPKYTAAIPSVSKARIERERTIDQRQGAINVFAKVAERAGSVAKYARVFV